MNVSVLSIMLSRIQLVSVIFRGKQADFLSVAYPILFKHYTCKSLHISCNLPFASVLHVTIISGDNSLHPSLTWTLRLVAVSILAQLGLSDW